MTTFAQTWTTFVNFLLELARPGLVWPKFGHFWSNLERICLTSARAGKLVPTYWRSQARGERSFGNFRVALIGLCKAIPGSQHLGAPCKRAARRLAHLGGARARGARTRTPLVARARRTAWRAAAPQPECLAACVRRSLHLAHLAARGGPKWCLRCVSSPLCLPNASRSTIARLRASPLASRFLLRASVAPRPQPAAADARRVVGKDTVATGHSGGDACNNRTGNSAPSQTDVAGCPSSSVVSSSLFVIVIVDRCPCLSSVAVVIHDGRCRRHRRHRGPLSWSFSSPGVVFVVVIVVVAVVVGHRCFRRSSVLPAVLSIVPSRRPRRPLRRSSASSGLSPLSPPSRRRALRSSSSVVGLLVVVVFVPAVHRRRCRASSP